MWNYSEKVVDHFLHPRNVGELENPDCKGEVGSVACGDMLRFTFKLDPDGRITEARFKTFGCASAIASSSALTEMVKGKTLEEAQTITNRDIAEFLGGLPNEKMHCSVMGREALDAAIKAYHGEVSETKQLDGNIVCHCFGVTEPELQRVIRENTLTTLEEIAHYTKAGGSCGMCRDELTKVLEDTRGEHAPHAHATSSDYPTTTVGRIHRVEEVIAERIQPALARDGGSIELVDLDGTTVLVKLKGSCAGCPGAAATLKHFVEKEFQKALGPDIKVQEV